MTMTRILSPDMAFATCERIARQHYENFPVASLLLPREKRRYVAAIYAFARGADDIADEGTLPPGERLQGLDEWEALLDQAFTGSPEHPIFIAIGATARETGIPRSLLAALLRAFRRDVTTHRYRTFPDLLGYCEDSANPIGRLLLHLFDCADERTVRLSDYLCTALQLANFWQDVSVDLARGRLYIPLEDCDRFGYTERDLTSRRVNDSFRRLMQFEVERTQSLFDAATPLLMLVGRRLRFELALTVRGGRAILAMVEKLNYDVLTKRPVLGFRAKLGILARTLKDGMR